MSILIYVGVAILLYALWLPSVKMGLKRLTCTRQFSRTTVYQGEEAELVEVVRNDSPFTIPWLRLESRISPYIQLGSQQELHVSDEMYYCSLFTLMPYQQIRRRHRVRFLRRGYYNLGNASLTAGDFLGILSFHKSQELESRVVVYPRLLEDNEIPHIMSRMMGELSRRPQLLRDPFLVRGIRPYQLGDPVRDIHWPATARTGQVQVRVRDYTTRTKLLVVLNGQYLDVQFSENLPESKEPMIEYGISLAATVCARALRDGLAAGFASNMSVQDSEDPTVLLPADGAARTEELLAVCARLETKSRQKFPAFLDALAVHSGLDILVLSCYDSEGIQNGIARLRSSGNQVTLHLLEGGGQ
jgi:uncharacterized protein (DUF58 family)